MPAFINATVYGKEGIAILEDTAGKFIVTEDSPDMIPLYDAKTEKIYQAWFNKASPCALVQSRSAMLT